MPYVTNADIEERLGTLAYVQLTDDAGSGTADLDKVNEARLGAEGEVDSYLAARYAVPVDLVAHPELSAVLRTFVLDLVEYRLRNRRPPVPANVARRRDEAIAWLRRAADGTVQLPAAAAPASHPTRSPAQTVGPPRDWTRESARDL
jgi:phage gp36-like protein